MLALGGRARRGVHVVITIAAVAAAAVAGTTAPAGAATAAGQSVQPGPPAVFSRGWNGAGEVGDGTTTPRATPVPVLGLPSVHGLQVTMRQIVSGYLSQACAASALRSPASRLASSACSQDVMACW